jgi:UDP-2,3-diacylglucosamine hydrolase
MRAIFIADAHLRNPEDENYCLMLRFLSELPGKTDRLFILGDFFEFWIGDSPESFPHYRPLVHLLEQVTSRGIELFFVEGNHDFHLGGYFRKAFHAKVFPDAATLEMDGKRFFLCHGDLINAEDRGYRLLRAIFRNPLTRQLVRLLPPAVPAFIASVLGKQSKKSHVAKASRWDYSSMIRKFAGERFVAGDDVVVTAHFHRPLIEKSGERTLLALGDWITEFSYGEWLDGEISLKHYKT